MGFAHHELLFKFLSLLVSKFLSSRPNYKPHMFPKQ